MRDAAANQEQLDKEEDENGGTILLVNKTHRPNHMNRCLVSEWWVLAGAFLFLGLVLYIPFLRGLFRFALLHPLDLAICLLVGFSSILWFEVFKLLQGRKK